ncbi:MAG TPA: HlyD family efflux transporter periplasmic adaptor subunit [Blastocatellia bacterium]|nr:HlyD family efflux transporter periplasmic adaptor subunit [Blastocatellia bacterium]
MTLKKVIPILALLVVVLILGAVWVNRLRTETTEVISVSGSIELTEVTIAFKIPGRLDELLVREGEWVKKGQVVARLDREQLQRQYERAQAGLRAAESNLRQLLTAIALQRETLEGQIEQRRAELAQAEAVLRELQAGSRAQEIEQARAAVQAARTEYERAARDWERAKVLRENDDISVAQFDQFKTRYEAAQAQLRQAEERLALLVEGPRPETIEAARAQVARARAGLRVTEAQRLELQRREEEVTARRADIERARAEVALIQSQLADTVAVSPIDGIVLVTSANAGEVVAAGTPVLTIGDIARPWLRGYISETDLGRVKLGQEARVTTDSFPGKVYRGRVAFISSEAEFTPKQIQTPEERVKLVYRIKIEVENPNQELKLNMPATAVILLR